MNTLCFIRKCPLKCRSMRVQNIVLARVETLETKSSERILIRPGGVYIALQPGDGVGNGIKLGRYDIKLGRWLERQLP